MLDNKGPTRIIMSICVLIFAALCLALTLFMPWAEIGLPTGKHIPEVLQSLGLVSFFDWMSNQLPLLLKNAQHDPNYDYYVYSFFLGLALFAAAIGLNLTGRVDSEEKTNLPVKK